MQWPFQCWPGGKDPSDWDGEGPVTSELTVVTVRANILIALELRGELCGYGQYLFCEIGPSSANSSPRNAISRDRIHSGSWVESTQDHLPWVPNVMQKAMTALKRWSGLVIPERSGQKLFEGQGWRQRHWGVAALWLGNLAARTWRQRLGQLIGSAHVYIQHASYFCSARYSIEWDEHRT